MWKTFLIRSCKRKRESKVKRKRLCKRILKRSKKSSARIGSWKTVLNVISHILLNILARFHRYEQWTDYYYSLAFYIGFLYSIEIDMQSYVEKWLLAFIGYRFRSYTVMNIFRKFDIAIFSVIRNAKFMVLMHITHWLAWIYYLGLCHCPLFEQSFSLFFNFQIIVSADI